MKRDRAVVKRRECGLCRRGVEANDMCGRLWLDGDCAAHHKCMQYSSKLGQYKMSTFGGFYPVEVLDEIRRGGGLKCHICKTKSCDASRVRGATCGCAIKGCRATYHYPCAKESALTARLVNNASKVVLYRVFCSTNHKEQYKKKYGNEYSYTADTDTSDEDSEQMDNERGHSNASARRRSRTSSSPVLQNGAVNASSQLQQKHCRTRSLSPRDGKKCRVSTDRRSSTKVHRQVSENNADERPMVLGTVAECPKDLRNVSVENNHIETASQCHDFVLCFIECDTSALTNQHKSEVQMFAEQLYSVGQKHVIVHVPKVDDTPLPAQHMIYLMQEVSQALREQNYQDLERLIFGLSGLDVNKYECFDQLHRNLGKEKHELIHIMMHDVIKCNLSEAESVTGLKVGKLCKVCQMQVFILCLHVCDLTDPMYRLRSCLSHKPHTPFQWTQNTCLMNIATFSGKMSEYFCQQEVVELQSWLECNAELEVSYFDDSESHAMTCTSAIFQLKEYFQYDYNTQPHGSTLFLLGPVDYAEETAVNYVNNWIPEILRKTLMSGKDVFVVMGINMSHATCSLSDLTPPLQDNVELKVYSFADPSHLPVTCVLLHFKLSAIKQVAG